MTLYNFHPIANAFELLQGQPFEELQEDIKTRGLIQPIILYDNKILDGRNRFRACVSSSIEPRFITYNGNEPAAYATSLNSKRRHDTIESRIKAGVELIPWFEKEAKRRMVSTLKQNAPLHKKLCSDDKGETIMTVAKAVGTNKEYIRQGKILKDKEPDIYNKLGITLTIADAKREIKKAEYAKKVEKAKANPQKETFNGPFDLILSDPPWSYDFSSTHNRDIENQYDILAVDEIIKHKPNSSDNAVLFLWATAPKLLEALDVMKAWGFTYRTNAIWDKEIIGCGHWFRGQHELLLVGVKGKPGCPPHSERISSVLKERRTTHSKKPECVYEWLERAFPDKTKLEMYCRTPRKGWSAWGNEI